MRRAAFAILGTAAATSLLVGIKAQAGPDTADASAQQPEAPVESTAPPAGNAGAPAKPSDSAPAAPAAKKITGNTVNTPYGPVTVTITVAGNKITGVDAKLPTAGESAAIAANAGPKLKEQTLAKQSADIDTVSGATYTSEGYKNSLQSALDKRG
jgi:uncharacterized protein with FMN-binding domain